jgi:hypothetical protein
MTALDLCCGDGYFTAPLARIVGGRVYALDFDPDLIARARGEAEYQGVTVRQWITADACDLAAVLPELVDFRPARQHAARRTRQARPGAGDSRRVAAGQALCGRQLAFPTSRGNNRAQRGARPAYRTTHVAGEHAGRGRAGPLVGRVEPTGLADSGHLAAGGDRPDQQPVVAVLITV